LKKIINRINYLFFLKSHDMPTASKTHPASAKKPSSAIASAATRGKKVAAQKPSAPAKAIKSNTSPAQGKAPVTDKPAPLKKAKLVRDSFTLPESDHALIKQCKKVAISQGRETKKSEVLRAAIQVFHALPLNAQLAAYKKLAVVAVGRPKSV
jgi:hypothetical protein